MTEEVFNAILRLKGEVIPSSKIVGVTMLMKDTSLAGKRVLVTAGASGIGLTITRGFVQSGAECWCVTSMKKVCARRKTLCRES